MELGEGDEDADLYDPPDPPPRPVDKDTPESAAKPEEGDTSKPLPPRPSEDGNAFSIGDEEFGEWAEDDDEDTYVSPKVPFNRSTVDGSKTPLKGKHD